MNNTSQLTNKTILITGGTGRPLCNCGCGQIPILKSSNFCKGHSTRIYSLERGLKISIALKNYKKTPEHRLAISLSKKGKKPNLSEEVRTKKRKRFLTNNPMHDTASRESHRKALQEPDYRDRVSLGLCKHYLIPENRKKHGHEQTLEKREKNRQAQLKRYSEWTDEDWATFSQACSNSAKQTWKNGRDKSYLINNIYDNISVKPNKQEEKLKSVLESAFPNEWTYVGDFSFRIGRKCPDFINFKKNLLIELYGSYWHKDENPDDRINFFKSFGYSTLIIWEDELKFPNYIIEKVSKWMQLAIF